MNGALLSALVPDTMPSAFARMYAYGLLVLAAPVLAGYAVPLRTTKATLVPGEGVLG